jgi:hypothetical protein
MTIDADNFIMPDEAPQPPADQPAGRYERKQEAATDLTLDRGLPANVDAEKTILGAVLLDQSALTEIKLQIECDDFSLDSNRRIAMRMYELWDEKIPIDIVTLANRLNRFKEVEAVGGVAYLASLTEGLPRRPVINEYLRIVRDKSILRQIMLVGNSTVALAADQSTDAVGVMQFLDRNLEGIKERVRVLMQRGADSPFFVGYETFVATAPEEIDWTVDGIIQRDGNGLIIGDSGTSKSVLVFDLAIHMICGATWFQHIISRPVKVGLVAREDAPGLSQSRLKRLIDGAPEGAKMFLDVTNLEETLYVNTRAQRETWTLQSEPDIQDIVAAIKEKQIEFVFFDVFRALWEGNENDNQETAKVLGAATRISREGKCQVCIVHHLSKSDKGSIFDRARGGGINGWKEWGIAISIENPGMPPKDTIRKVQFHTKADVSANDLFYKIVGSEHAMHLEHIDAPSAPVSQPSSKKKKPKGEQQAMDYSQPPEEES